MALPDLATPGRGRGRLDQPGSRTLVLLSLAAAGVWSAWSLGLRPSEFWPEHSGWQPALRFFSQALQPALRHESIDLPAGTPPLLWQVATAALKTVVFAAAAMPPAILLGLLLGCGASSVWWSGQARTRRGRLSLRLGPAVSVACRSVAALLRSVHELLWAVLFLAAWGLMPLAAVAALALPYAGTLAKVFAEMLDESPREAAGALAAAGATPAQAFLAARLPEALPDMMAYTLYRFECALRTAAVLGFFGFPTLGYHIAAAFENLHLGEVWTYLHALLLLVLLVDWWSGSVRRRLVS